MSEHTHVRESPVCGRFCDGGIVRHVGAGKIHLVAVDTILVLEKLDELYEFIDAVGHDAHDDGHADAAQERKLLGNEFFSARVLQADGVKHARWRFDDTLRGIAETGLQRDRLGHDAAEFAEVDEFLKFFGVAERPGSGQHRVLQLYFSDLRRKIYSHTISAPENTGPSQQAIANR